MNSAYFDKAFDPNTQGRISGRCRDGQFTRLLVINMGTIEVYNSEEVCIYRHWERLPEGFIPLSLGGDPSGFDDGTGRKLLVTVGGFDANTSNSRTLGIRTGLAVKEAWERYG